MNRLRYARNAIDGNGTLFRGDFYQVTLESSLGGTTGHRIWETKTTPQYQLGARLVLEDGRVFRYALATTTVTPGFGASNKNIFNAITGGCVRAQAVGDTSVVFLCDATTGGASWFGTKNRMAGGYVSIPVGTITQFRRIVSHAATANGSNVTVNLDMPLTEAVTATKMAEVMQNPYSALYPGGNFDSVVGVPLTTIATGYYGWIQTWGPTWIVPDVAGVGSEAHGRQLIFVGNGAIELKNDMDPTTYSCQHAGFILGTSVVGDWANPPFVMLQISP